MLIGCAEAELKSKATTAEQDGDLLSSRVRVAEDAHTVGVHLPTLLARLCAWLPPAGVSVSGGECVPSGSPWWDAGRAPQQPFPVIVT